MANTGAKTYQVDIATNPSTIMITAEPVASNVVNTVPVDKIVDVLPLYFDYSPAIPVSTPATGYTATPNHIVILGVYTNDLVAGDKIVITGSTSNDGTYTAISASDDGVHTTIVVTEAIVAVPVDGTVTFTPDNGGVENNNSGKEFAATYPYKRMTQLILTLQDGSKLQLELQSITNQATWSKGTKAALKVAALAINALL